MPVNSGLNHMSILVLRSYPEADVDEFMSRLRKYAGATELTREMCLDLIGYVTVDENTGRTKPRKIHIYYKFLDKELADKHNALA